MSQDRYEVSSAYEAAQVKAATAAAAFTPARKRRFTARCTTMQSAVLRLHVVRLSICLPV